MGITQTNTFTCDRCGGVHNDTREADIYDDPTINPPNGWGYSLKTDEFLCDTCRASESK